MRGFINALSKATERGITRLSIVVGGVGLVSLPLGLLSLSFLAVSMFCFGMIGIFWAFEWIEGGSY